MRACCSLTHFPWSGSLFFLILKVYVWSGHIHKKKQPTFSGLGLSNLLPLSLMFLLRLKRRAIGLRCDLNCGNFWRRKAISPTFCYIHMIGICRHHCIGVVCGEGTNGETLLGSVKVLGSGTGILHFSSPHEFNQHFGEPLKVLGRSQMQTVPSKTTPSFISIMCFALALLSLWFDLGYTGPV